MDRDPKTSSGVAARKGNGQAQPATTKQRKPTAKAPKSSQKVQQSSKTANSAKNSKIRSTAKKATTPAARPDSKASAATSRTAAPSAPKRSKAPLIVSIVVAVLLLGGLILGAWYFLFYNQPAKVVLDAVNSVLTDDNLALNGEVQFLRTESRDSGLAWAVFKFDSSSQTLPNTTNAQLRLGVQADEEIEELEFDLGVVQAQDGVLYLRISGIMAAIDQQVSDEVYDEMSDLFELLDLVDGEWWRISISEISSYFGWGETGAHYQSLYDCGVQLLDQNHAGELHPLYRAHPFLTITKDSSVIPQRANTTIYQAQIDHEQLAQFLNQLPETDAAESYYACYNQAMQKLYQSDYIALPWGGGFHPDPSETPVMDATSFDELTSEDVDDFLPEDLQVQLYIDNWTHELHTLTLNFQLNDQYSAAGVFYPVHRATVTFTPDQYRPITELLEELVDWAEALVVGAPSA